MLVFIDESGDPGFKLSKGSSQLFAAAMVIFATAQAAELTAVAIDGLAKRLRIKPEFKFSSCKVDVRDEFFGLVARHEFSVRAIVVPKAVIYSQHLRTNKDDFYRYFVRSLIRYDNGRLRRAKVVVDGSGDRIFRRDLQSYLKNQTPTGCVDKLVFKNSKNDRLIQLADMVVGAIVRSHRTDRADARRWRDMIEHRIEDEWIFR